MGFFVKYKVIILFTQLNSAMNMKALFYVVIIEDNSLVSDSPLKVHEQ